MITQEDGLSSGQRELVAVGASIGAGCHPCVDHHLKAGAEAGLDGDRLLAAVTSAERVKAEAAVRIGDHVRERLGPSLAAPAMLSPLEEALVSLGALGANDLTGIKRHFRLAAELGGVSRRQLQQAIEGAHTVQENALRIHRREAEHLLEALVTPVAVPASAEESLEGSCGCGAADEAEAASVGAQTCAAGDTSDIENNPATDRTCDHAPSFSPAMAAFCPPADTRGLGSIAAAMANCRGMFEGARPHAGAPTENDEPTATEAARSCT
jgi:AhpD family alkylhydroperoxidase